MTNAVVLDTQDQLEPYRTELRGYCYRMLGSIFEADDAVQDTMVRAWRNLDQFEGRSSLRSWLYRIATNVCLTMLDSKQRRARPVDLGPSTTADRPPGAQRPDVEWVEPAPDAMVLPSGTDPSETVVLRESIRLAFVAALQYLPARQRAVLILREVLHWSAEETAQLLESSVASVNSALQRARATMAELDTDAPAATTPAQQDFLERYADAFQRYDMDALVAVLRDDVVMSMPPYEMWFQGPTQVRDWMTGWGHECEGSRLLPAAANNMATYGQYRRNQDGPGYHAWGLVILDVDDSGIKAINTFLDTPRLFPLFGLPLSLD